MPRVVRSDATHQSLHTEGRMNSKRKWGRIEEPNDHQVSIGSKCINGRRACSKWADVGCLSNGVCFAGKPLVYEGRRPGVESAAYVKVAVLIRIRASPCVSMSALSPSSVDFVSLSSLPLQPSQWTFPPYGRSPMSPEAEQPPGLSCRMLWTSC